MGKPTKAMFTSWFEIEAERPAADLFKTMPPLGAGNRWPDQLIVERLRLADQAYEDQYQKLHRSSLWKWLETQPGFIRVWERTGIKKNRLKAVREPHKVDVWIDRALLAYKTEVDPVRATSHIEALFEIGVSGSWLSGLIHALYECFYSDRAEQMYKARKEAVRVVERFKRSLGEIVQLVDYGLSDTPIVGGPMTTLRRLHNDPVGVQSLAYRVLSMPIRRDSAHKAETLFVYRMWSKNKSLMGSPKPEIIAELMTLDGFEYQPDARTIQRICARFTAAKRHKK